MQESTSLKKNESEHSIAVVIPCYKVVRFILAVIKEIGPEVSRIYIVDDACPEGTGKFVQEHNNDARVKVLFNASNQGVGGAMVTGYKAALAEGASIVVKLDGDGQMNPHFINKLTKPISEGRADYAKGNRFYTLDSVKEMPSVRIFGNAVLSFMSKLSTGYWHIFDPTNGYTAVHSKVLSEIPLDKLDKRFFFETDMLFRLYTLQAVVKDVPMKAVYGSEASNLRVSEAVAEFFYRHIVNLLKRIFYCYVLRNFTAFTIELIVGIALLSFGIIFGGIEWYRYASRDILTPTGIIMIAAMSTLIGLQLVLSFLNWDASNDPKDPLHKWM